MSRRLLIAYGLLLFVLIVLRTAWLSDHAYLALRTADNAAWGLGFRWNAAERAQVFDHPLWMLCLYLARLTTGEVYYGTLVLSIVCAVTATWLLLRQAVTDTGVLVVALVLALSPTLITYSTSGLGTPLVHVLIVAFAALALREPRRVYVLSALAALAALTDPATLLLTVPVTGGLSRLKPARGLSPFLRRMGGLSAFSRRIRGLSPGLRTISGGQSPRLDETRGQSPIIARGPSPIVLIAPVVAVGLWAAVSVFYYGSIVPLATVARLHQGISAGERLHGGLLFVLDAVRRDPLLVGTIATGLLLPFIRRTPGERALAGGALLYTAAILGSGGSTWAGYGLTVPLLVALLIVARQPYLQRRRVTVGALATVALLALVTPVHTFASHAQYGLRSAQQAGIIDPRQQDYQATGLLLVRRNQWFPEHPESVRGLRASERHDPLGSSPRPGFFGYAAGRRVYVLEPTGLGDPLLSRLRPGAPRQPGHSMLELRARTLPDGYIESLQANRNLITDPALRTFYDRVRFVTRSPLGENGRAMNAAWLALRGASPMHQTR